MNNSFQNSGKYSRNDMKDFETLLEELEARYAEVELDDDSPSFEEILSMFDDNGNWINETHCEDNVEELLRELEERFAGVEDPGDLFTVEEILEMYDDNGNKKEKETEHKAVEDVDKEGRRRKRRLRRSNRNKRCKYSDKVDIKIIQTNCDDFTSKKESFHDILKDKAPDILLIQETALKEKRKIKLKDYFSFCKNR